MANVSKIKLPSGVTYDLRDDGALPLTGGTVTGPVIFQDTTSMDDATLGNLVVNGNASFTNNIQANTINGVTVGSNPKFTDTNTVTTATTTGSGNAVTAVTASNGALTITKGTTFLTSHQDISGKADKSATVSTITYDSTNKKITKTINGTTTDVVTVATLKTALGSMPASDVSSWAKASSKPTYTASEVGALASNTTYVSTITTTAGTHSAISSKSGAVSFNVPTKTSHLTNDSGFLTSHQDISGKVNKSGDTMTGNLIVPAERIANTYYGISFGRTTETPVETILYTGIKWIHGRHMPVVHVTGYAYGLNSPVEFKIGFYLYGDPTCKVGWCGVTNMGAWSPEVYLFKYTRNNIEYVAVGFKGSCYFLQLQVDLQDEMGKFGNIELNSNYWSWSFLTTTGTIPAADGGTTCVQVPYKADILNPSKVNGHTVNSDVPANAKFTDTVPTTTQSKATGISIGNHATGTVIGVQSSTTTASKATAGTAVSIPNVTSAGSASNWVFENITVPVAASATACDDITSWSAGSGSASLTMAIDSSDSKKLNITFSHTHTAPTLQYTARSIAGVSGSVTASHVKSGGNGTAPTLGTAISITPYTFSDVTVPIKNTSASTFVTGTTHTITDNGHTHSI